MIKIEYITRRGCPACEIYRETVIEPLTSKYPDQVYEHWAWDGFMEKLNNSKLVTHIPLVVLTDNGEEVLRFSELPSLDQLEGALRLS